MAKLFLAIAAILGGLSVAGGAFATHSLKNSLSEKALATFETGIRYQMYHALALLIIALLLLTSSTAPQLLTASGWAFVAGVVFFSGSLYVLSLANIKWMGAVAPLGGLGFLTGWGLLAIAAVWIKV
ncbi:MAG: DUF423 domain-containing protein [Cyanobacteria bacterium P01_H01_bin.119]